MENIEIIKKNNELFANSLTYLILGKQNFLKILYLSGFKKNDIDNYKKLVENFLNDYKKRINEKLEKLEK